MRQGDRMLVRAADVLVRQQFDVRPGEGVLITADHRTQAALLDALLTAILRVEARPVVATIPRLPFQGALAVFLLCCVASYAWFLAAKPHNQGL